jgi:hypothetical protein
MNKQIASEQRNWTKPRGLIAGKDSFEVYVSKQFRCARMCTRCTPAHLVRFVMLWPSSAHYDKVFASTLAQELRQHQAERRRTRQGEHPPCPAPPRTSLDYAPVCARVQPTRDPARDQRTRPRQRAGACARHGGVANDGRRALLQHLHLGPPGAGQQDAERLPHRLHSEGAHAGGCPGLRLTRR